MWLEHLLFGAVIDTSFAVSCKALALYSEKSFSYTVRRTAISESSLTSLRQDNEVKLEDEIQLVCNAYKIERVYR